MQASEIDTELVEPELIQDFMEESRNAFEEIESLWLKVEIGKAAPEDFIELMHRLHLVSSVLRIGGHDNVAELGERIISVLDRVQNKRLAGGELVNDVILFAIEHLESLTEALMASQELDREIVQQKSDALRRLLESEEADVQHVAETVLEVFTQKRLGVSVEAAPAAATPAVSLVLPSVDHKERQQPAASNDLHKREGDLAFFRDMNAKMERRYPEQRGRGARIWQIANAMNAMAGTPIDPKQLEAAVYVHDFGMAFLAAEPLRSGARWTDDERRQLHEHPLTGAELLLHVGGWSDAAHMVLQHHEREDGRGYPEGISGDTTCDGAKILAIADTIYAMTHKQTYRSFARPLFRAVSEINSCVGSQFSPYWVEIFNKAIRSSRGNILFGQQT